MKVRIKGAKKTEMLIAQISDLHIRPENNLYQGVVNSNKMCLEAINYLNELDRKVDLVLVTGDVVDEGRSDEYKSAVSLLAKLKSPYLVIPGNHDDRENFRRAFENHDYLPAQGELNYCIDDYPVRFIGLDSCITGQHHGCFSQNSLVWLESILEADRIKPTIIMMHHHPFISGISYLDKYRHQEPDVLEAIMTRFCNIEAIVCGHVHRTMVKSWGGTIICSCPSTTTEIDLQLNPQANPQSYEGIQACLLHLWSEHEGLISHVSHIGSFKGPYPFA